MPLTPESIYSVVRVLADQGGEQAPVGTGFCVYVRSEADPKLRYGYVLTAHHVIKDQENIELEIPNPFEDGTFYPRMKMTDWRQPIPELDLALASIRPYPNYNIQSLEYGHHIIPDLNLLLGAKFYYIGLLAPLDRPIVRSGTLGALDQTGIPHDGDYDYVTHLADCRSYGGFSGSPCFVEIPFVSLEPALISPSLEVLASEIPSKIGSMVYLHLLCGMFTEHINGKNADRLVSRAGVGMMLRSNEIAEALMTDGMQAERRRWDTEEMGNEEDKIEGVSSSDDEFDRFEDLTSKLMQVPKSEIDKKRKNK
jgi:hypothetical protein